MEGGDWGRDHSYEDGPVMRESSFVFSILIKHTVDGYEAIAVTVDDSAVFCDENMFHAIRKAALWLDKESSRGVSAA